MHYPKYRGEDAELGAHVKLLCDNISNNGPLVLQVKFGVGRIREYNIVDVRAHQWREGVEVFAVFQTHAELTQLNAPERHITLDQPMLVTLLQQAGFKWGDAVLPEKATR